MSVRNTPTDYFFDAFLGNSYKETYPPTNTLFSDDAAVIQMAVAGYRAEELQVELNAQELIVSGKKLVDTVHTPERGWRVQSKGISQKAFTRKWEVSSMYEISDVSLDSGILTILFIRKAHTSKHPIEIRVA